MSFLKRAYGVGGAAVLWTLGAPWHTEGAGAEAVPRNIPDSFPLEVPEQGHSGFFRVGPESGVHFTNRLAADRSLTNQIYLNGSGVAAGDFDADGRCDLFFCALGGPCALFRNLGGWKFEDVAAKAGVDCLGVDATGAAFVDIDGDTDLDLLVNAVGRGTLLYLNDGKGHFINATEGSNLEAPNGSMSLALADIDGDGDLDLYVANYRTSTLRDHPNTRFRVRDVDGKPVVIRVDDQPVTSPDLLGRYEVTANRQVIEHGQLDSLYRNDGNGRFTLLPFSGEHFRDESGAKLTNLPYDWGLSAVFRDMNGDGAPDLYVCNDFDSPDRMWMNDGWGNFRAHSKLALRKTSRFSMGIDFADLNHDGLEEFVVLDMLSPDPIRRQVQIAETKPVPTIIGEIDNRPQYSRNTLFLNQGDGTYAEIAYYAGLDATEWSWNPVFLDVDLDGFDDLFVSAGHERDATNADAAAQIAAKRTPKMANSDILALRRLFPILALPKLAYRNQGDLTFEPKTKEWGLDVVGVAHGVALADLDGDGDLDIAMNQLNGPALLFRNETAAPRIAVRLKGQPPNTAGIGAEIRLSRGDFVQCRQVICGGRYLSSDDPLKSFAALNRTNKFSLEVLWRSGRRSILKEVSADHLYLVTEPSSETVSPRPTANPPSSLFEDRSDVIQHVHTEQPFDDFVRQPLLPRRLSQLGPGVAWADLDGDGYEDLIIGAGRGGVPGILLNDRQGGFHKAVELWQDVAVTQEMTGIITLPFTNGSVMILAGLSSYETSNPGGSALVSRTSGQVDSQEILPAWDSSVGPLAASDFDADGDLDVFVGGRVMPGAYPRAASSLLLRNNSGRLEVDSSLSAAFKNVGLVSAAVWTDLNNDGFPELALALEWGPIRIWRNIKGELSEITADLGLTEQTGWWNGIAAGDFDGDGLMDLVASNWGLNSPYRPRKAEPVRVYYGDLDRNGTLDIIESIVDPISHREVPIRTFKAIRDAMPFLRERIDTFEQYGRATLSEIYGESFQKAEKAQATWLTSTVFLNRGNRFEAHILPTEAQLSPAFAVSVADFEGDGQEDIFISQNFFAVSPESSRLDAGHGLLLRGNGRGQFESLSAMATGLRIYGEQRGAAVADYDQDGKMDIVVAQNGAQTKLFRNLRGKPGLRVRLTGPPGNPQAIGAVVRLKSGDRLAAARELHGGSGYWSQDSPVTVVSAPFKASEVWIRWPGGRVTVVPVQPDAREVRISEPRQ